MGQKLPHPKELGIFSNFRWDFPSGFVVFLVALPLCLGIALASGAPLFSGIITGIIGGIVVGSYSHSPLSVSGPAAGLTVIVLTAITQLQSYEGFLVAVVLAGILQILLGIIRAGIIAHYFPSAVIKGMLAAIGLILVLKQIPHALGYDFDFEGDFSFDEKGDHNTFSDIWYAIHNTHLGAVIISVVSLGILISWELPFIKNKAYFKALPGALLMVVTGVLLNQFFKIWAPELYLQGDHLVVLPVASTFNEFCHFFTFPDFTFLANPDVYIIAATIAVIASIETLLSVEATDRLDPYKRNTPTNRELRAQGFGNIISGLLGGIPLTAVIVRSSTNINAGGKTRMSTIFHGILLLSCVAFIPTYLNIIPLASLAALLLLVGYKLAKIGLFKTMYKLGWDQFIPFSVTVIGILFTDLLKGIGIGMAFSIFYILRNNYRTPYSFHKEQYKEGEKIIIKLAEEVTFLNKGSILLMLENIPENSEVMIDGSNSASIDYDVLEMIELFKETAKLKNIKLELKNIRSVKPAVH